MGIIEKLRKQKMKGPTVHGTTSGIGLQRLEVRSRSTSAFGETCKTSKWSRMESPHLDRPTLPFTEEQSASQALSMGYLPRDPKKERVTRNLEVRKPDWICNFVESISEIPKSHGVLEHGMTWACIPMMVWNQDLEAKVSNTHASERLY
ncbi:DNA-directed RNA polymerase subunit beta' [Striga asiatica]|uniref:DNA-directed RNA polymerase subunit beta n=1 Tax=Striga asiatica TaxID=4170 RepID=A0A5A7Q5V2_STRAF|nr:DNA-directed RNA polymerase subunit beta' [Striga asiatica]